MKRLFSTSLIALLAALSAYGQVLSVDYTGDMLPARYMQRIMRTLHKEVEFYGPLGLGDTVKLKLLVFKDREDGNAYVRQFNPTVYGDRYAGVFLTKTKTAVIMGTHNLEYSCTTICHEISHFLLDQTVPAKYMPYSLNEGLASYFGYLKVRKDGTAVEEIPEGRLGSVKTQIMLGEFDLDRYIDMNYKGFHDEDRHDSHQSYKATNVMTAVMFEKIGEEGMRAVLRDIKEKKKLREAIENNYPGGCKGLKDDIVRYVESK
ncbi:MAG: hypothetical protein IJ799_03855 [Bacteroidales bacterium]|nr:hypothetical protein [Bacteroidales bacterium]